jgi:spermidine synthase
MRPDLSSLFALTMLLGATLLFVVQPMIAKMVLPLLGGSPSVWNTCMVFFQAALLAGYAYAHASSAWLRPRRQALLHVGLMLTPLWFLPLGVPREWASSLATGTNPGPWLLGLLLATVGLPFFVVSTTTPLLQRWFSRTDHPAASDPYFLYAASNIGCMVALLSYPIVVEPALGSARQGWFWAAGYGIFLVLMLACAAVVWRTPQVLREVAPDPASFDRSDRLRISQWLRWVALAFLPSSLMLGVTMHLTTDVAAIPLIWVIPLAIYLLSFILVFAKRPLLTHPWMVRIYPMVVVILLLTMWLKGERSTALVLHLATFFVTAMVCHGELARRRPEARHLTAFYLAMSLGGVLGGVLNALVAPLVFDWVAEYPLVLALSCLALPSSGAPRSSGKDRVLDIALPLALGALFVGLNWLLPRAGSRLDGVGLKLVLGLAAFLCFTFKDRPVRFALGIGVALLAIHGLGGGDSVRVLLRERNFFGVLQVVHDNRGNVHRLVHGNTLHGQQSLDPKRRREALSYYHRTGPIGQLLEDQATRPARTNVAVVGLGAGSLACYATDNEAWTFYEIDPAIVRIARDPRFFTYLSECRARSCEIILGDAKLQLKNAPRSGYGLIVLDAFSSDAIPIHLLTREALRLYRAKLADRGLIAFHISNRHIDLTPVLGALARDAGLISRVRSDLKTSPDQVKDGKSASIWLVMAARTSDLGALANDPSWVEPRLRADEAVWTDDYSNLVAHFIRPW